MKNNPLLGFLQGFLIAFLGCSYLTADELTIEPPEIWDSPCEVPLPPRCDQCILFPLPDCEETDQVVVNLRNPIYENGVLFTTEGGLLEGPSIRIQAKNIQYVRQLTTDLKKLFVSCSEDVLIDYHNQTLAARSIEYDFITQCGILFNGKIALLPWYIEGEKIELCPNGNLIFHEAYISTSEGDDKEIKLIASTVEVTPDKKLTATNIRFELKQATLLWVPKISLDLSADYESPIAVTFGWGGYPGTHVGLRAKLLSLNDFKAYGRVDGFLGRGAGAGIETLYCSSFRSTEFYTRNYYVHDLPLYDPEKKDRYRFQGSFFDRSSSGKTTVNIVYDVVSDGQMAQYYNLEDFEDIPAGRTTFDLRRENSDWIARLTANVQVNDFQSINEELPQLEWTIKPFEFPPSGVIFDGIFRLGFLRYDYSNAIFSTINEQRVTPPDFHSGRFEARPRFYYPMAAGPFTITPEATFIGIAYSDSAGGSSAGQALGDITIHAETSLYKCYGNFKHVMEPYLQPHFLTAPRVGINNHFIFTLDDSYTRLSLIRFGVRNRFFTKACNQMNRPFSLELWANAFFNSTTIPDTIPKGYVLGEWEITPSLFSAIDGAWNFQESQVDFFNTQFEWTLSNHAAIAGEYRYRSRYYWRKADFYNFVLEAARTREDLLKTVSDQRDTVLGRFFYRINPDWSAKFEARYGWHRRNQHHYFEYEIEFSTTIFDHWKLKFSFEKLESDTRSSFGLKLDPSPPKPCRRCF